jgi:hypothetical protein
MQVLDVHGEYKMNVWGAGGGSKSKRKMTEIQDRQRFPFANVTRRTDDNSMVDFAIKAPTDVTYSVWTG